MNPKLAIIGLPLLAALALVGCNSDKEPEETGTAPVTCMPVNYSLSDASYTMSGVGASDHVGDQVVALPDINGDGKVDFAIGSTTAADNGAFSGKVHIVESPITGDIDMSSAAATITGNDEYDYFATMMQSADVNGDGLGDLVVGARGSDAGATDGGAVYLFVGPIEGTLAASDADIKVYGSSDQAAVGYGATAMGDYSGDGNGDLVIGAYGLDRVYFYRSPFAPGTYGPSDARAIAFPERDNDHPGTALASPGDMDGDGLDDVLLGAYDFNASGSKVGKVYAIYDPLYYEDGEIYLELPTGGVVGTSESEKPGVDIKPAGDLDGDGNMDAYIGVEYSASGAGSREGKVIVVYGPLNTTFSVPDAIVTLLGSPGDQAGAQVSSAGDVDGDGNVDVLVGAPGSDVGGVDSGAAYLVMGPLAAGTTNLADADTIFSGAATKAGAGTDVASAGDQNGDGFADLLIGSPGDRGGLGTGNVSLVLGCVR